MAQNDIFEASFKIKHGDGIFAYAIYRPLVYLLMKTIFAKRFIQPNKLTVLSLILYISAGLSLIIAYFDPKYFPSILSWILSWTTKIRTPLLQNLFGLPFSIILFLLLYNLALLIDCLDGSVARYYGVSSQKGRLLDSFSDSFGHIFVMAGIMLYIFQYSILIASYYLAYYALSIVHLSFKFEELRLGHSKTGGVKALFRIGRLKILVGTLDYFVMSNNFVVIAKLISTTCLDMILLMTNLFWFGLLIGYVIVVYRGYKVVE